MHVRKSNKSIKTHDKKINTGFSFSLQSKWIINVTKINVSKEVQLNIYVNAREKLKQMYKTRD